MALYESCKRLGEERVSGKGQGYSSKDQVVFNKDDYSIVPLGCGFKAVW